MRKYQDLSLSEVKNVKIDLGQLYRIEGWLVGVDELSLVDNTEKPSFTLRIPDYVYKELTRAFPGRARVGGRFLIEEQAQVVGVLQKCGDNIKFESVDAVYLSEVGGTLEFFS